MGEGCGRKSLADIISIRGIHGIHNISEISGDTITTANVAGTPDTAGPHKQSRLSEQYGNIWYTSDLPDVYS